MNNMMKATLMTVLLFSAKDGFSSRPFVSSLGMGAQDRVVDSTVKSTVSHYISVKTCCGDKEWHKYEKRRVNFAGTKFMYDRARNGLLRLLFDINGHKESGDIEISKEYLRDIVSESADLIEGYIISTKNFVNNIRYFKEKFSEWIKLYPNRDNTSYRISLDLNSFQAFPTKLPHLSFIRHLYIITSFLKEQHFRRNIDDVNINITAGRFEREGGFKPLLDRIHTLVYYFDCLIANRTLFSTITDLEKDLKNLEDLLNPIDALIEQASYILTGYHPIRNDDRVQKRGRNEHEDIVSPYEVTKKWCL